MSSNTTAHDRGTPPTAQPIARVDGRRLAAFVVMLVVLAAAFLLVSRVTGASMVSLAPAYMFTPLVAGVAVSLTSGIPLRRIGLRIGRLRWLAVSALVAVPLVAAMLGLSLLLPGIGFDAAGEPPLGVELPGGVAGVAATVGLVLVLGTTVNAIIAFGEEVGWRGYLLWELAPLGFWKASGAIGLLWGVWHAPIIIEGYNFPSFPIAGIGVMTLACVAFTPLYVYLVVRARSVIAATLLHGVFNGSAGVVLVYTATDHAALTDLVANPVGAAGIAVFAVVTAFIAARGAPALDRAFASADPGSREDSR